MMDLLASIFGDAINDERRLVVFSTPDRRSEFFSNLADSTKYAKRLGKTQNVYFGMSLIGGQPAGRGRRDDTAAIGTLWADIDITGSTHASERLPTSIEEARGLLGELPLRPSIVVDSGHGLHAYWLLKEPWLFETNEDREQAATLARGWHGLVCSTAEARGWSLENLGDLTRVLRVPGTLNHNGDGDPAPVRIIECAKDLRYDLDDFEPFVAGAPAVSADGCGDLVLRPEAEPPAIKLAEALLECPQFRRTWEGDRPDLPDQSQSGYDLSMATVAALRGWGDQEIADLIVAARCRHHQNPAKALRPDYIRRTITRARTAALEASPDEDVNLAAFALVDEDECAIRRSPPPDPGPFPEHLLTVPGFMDDVIRFNLDTAKRLQPTLALAAAISLQSVLVARKVRDERGNRTNLYCVGVAKSGAGKDHGRKLNKNILFHAGLSDLDGNEDLASDSGLVAAVEHQPAILFQFDEFGRFLSTIGDPKKAPHLFNVIGVLMKLFSSADTVFRGKAYADRKHNKVIDQPCVSVFGTTVPANFFESLTRDSLNDGFIARMLVFETEDLPPRRRVAEQPIPQSIVDAARWWGDFNPGGNLRGEHPEPMIIPCTDEANECFDELAATVDAELAKPDGEAQSLWTRAEEKACRLALIYACSANHEQPRIDANAARWACDLSEYLTRRMLFVAHKWVAYGQFDARQKAVLRIIRDAGGEIGRRDLSRATQWWTQRERQEVIDNLLETDQVFEVTRPTATKPKLCYAIR